MNMKEINRYRLALIQYQISDKLPFLKSLLRTDNGFCLHFLSLEGMKDFPALFKLKPKEGYIGNSGYYECYWFEQGDTKSRIELLKEAINNLKN